MNAVEYLANKRVNIDLLLWEAPNGILHIGVRIRPWKQEGRRPRMVLSQGLTLADAIDKAARDYHLDRWEELDWTIRPWTPRASDYLGEEEEVQLDFLTPLEQSNTNAPGTPPTSENPPTKRLTRLMGGKST